jgi:hypothetical protein
VDDRLWRYWLVAAAWVCFAGSALFAQAPPEGAVSPFADFLVPSSSSASFSVPEPPPSPYVIAPPGWFTRAEGDVVKPHVASLSIGDPVRFFCDLPLGAAPLSWGSAGEVGLGYRTADANGFLLSLRGGSWVGSQRQGREAFGVVGPVGGDYLLGSTTAWLPDEGVPWAHDLHTRVGFGRLDLDYLGCGWSPLECERLGWSAGLRGAWMDTAFTAADSFGAIQRTLSPVNGAVLSEQAVGVLEHKRATLSVVAGGLHTAADWSWGLGQTGLVLYARADGGLLFGRQNGHYTHWENYAVPVYDPGRTTDGRSAFLGTFNASAGVQYVVLWRDGSLRLSAGYQFEGWYSCRLVSIQDGGSIGGMGGPSGPSPLFDSFGWTSHGVLLSAELVF